MFYDQIISLMPYAVAIRYSGLEPMPEEVDAAVAISAQIFAMAYKVINPN